MDPWAGSLGQDNSLEKVIATYFSSHNLDTVEKLCDRVYIIDQGRILQELDMEVFKSIGGDLESYFLQITQRVAKT